MNSMKELINLLEVKYLVINNIIMTELQLKIQKRAKKWLDFGCIVGYHQDEYSTELTYWKYLSYSVPDEYTIVRKIMHLATWKILKDDWEYEYVEIWQPMNYWRLCFVLTNDVDFNTWLWDIEKWKVLQNYMDHNRITFDQTVLEWSVEFQQIVLDYLETVDLSLIEK